MYDPIFSKSFNRYERKRFGFCALILCFIIALSFSSSFEHHLHPLPVVGNAVNLQLSINAEEDMLRTDDMIDDFNQTVESSTNLQELESAAEKAVLLNVTTPPIPLIIPSQNETTKKATMCTVLESNADYCDIEGHIRLDPISSTVFLLTDSTKITSSMIIQPYPRKGIPHVKNWTLTLAPNNDNNSTIPKCTKNHSFPAILFSIGGFSGNHFHDFADVLFPLYSTSFHFKRDVHFLATDYKPFWPSKFRPLLRRLTKHRLVDIDHEKDVHCYPKMILGVRFHRELIINTPLASRIFPKPLQPKTDTPSMSRFRQLLRKTYSLKRKNAINRRIRGRPRLLIISRKRTRIITNEPKISRAARKLGYDVVSAEGNSSTEFAQLVNSCDVMMGIHGAGLTNMLFLPDNAVLIQIVPFGRIDIFAKLDFGDPAQGMNIRYLEHNIQLKESSLVQRYPISDPIIRDPISVHMKGWDHFRTVYLDNQNVTLDVTTFRGTLSKALKLLRR